MKKNQLKGNKSADVNWYQLRNLMAEQHTIINFGFLQLETTELDTNQGVTFEAITHLFSTRFHVLHRMEVDLETKKQIKSRYERFK